MLNKTKTNVVDGIDWTINNDKDSGINKHNTSIFNNI